jgi:hypothetical protein
MDDPLSDFLETCLPRLILWSLLTSRRMPVEIRRKNWIWCSLVTFSTSTFQAGKNIGAAFRAMIGDRDSGPERFVAREKDVKDREVRFIVAGHTHHPKVALITADRHGERYYVDTGTWRNRIISTAMGIRQFGRLKALTYAVVYGSMEDKGNRSESAKLESFDYWSGFTQRW